MPNRVLSLLAESARQRTLVDCIANGVAQVKQGCRQSKQDGSNERIAWSCWPIREQMWVRLGVLVSVFLHNRSVITVYVRHASEPLQKP